MNRTRNCEYRRNPLLFSIILKIVYIYRCDNYNECVWSHSLWLNNVYQLFCMRDYHIKVNIVCDRSVLSKCLCTGTRRKFTKITWYSLSQYIYDIYYCFGSSIKNSIKAR